MVSVRCQTDEQLIGVGVIPLIQPGELQSISCDWQIPMDANVLRFSAVVDRGLEIQESDESNNVLEQLVPVAERVDEDGEETGGLFTGRTAAFGAVLLVLALLGLIVMFMPPKIKKIQ
jgi:hypothetical protein